MRSLILNIPLLGKSTREIRIYDGEQTLQILPFRSFISALTVVMISKQKGVRHECVISGTEMNPMIINISGYDTFKIERNSKIGVSREIKLIMR